MGNKLDGYLGNTLTGSKGDLGDYQHAARLYIDNNFRLSPRVKFLYYVVFNINANVAHGMQSKNGLELNYLVRSTDLPKFQIDTELFNQYNRKAHIYKKINYQPINMVLHDDNDGITNSLWALYYGYYFADRGNNSGPYGNVAPPAYQSTTYDNKAGFPFRYGLDNESDSKQPFLHSVELFTLSRHQFNSYLLCSPKITQWDHDTVNQDEGGGVINNKLTMVYDAVIYSNGIIQEDDPAGWAVLHYDKIESPIATENIIREGIEGVFGDITINNNLNSTDSYLSKPRRKIYYDTNRGHQIPFGYGSQSFYGQPYQQPLGGLSGIAFGALGGALGGLINAGIGMLRGNTTGADGIMSGSNQSQEVSDSNGVSSPENPGGTDPNAAAAQDAYEPPFPSQGTAVGSAVGDQGPVIPGAGNAQATDFLGNGQGVSGAGLEGTLGNTSNGTFGFNQSFGDSSADSGGGSWSTDTPALEQGTYEYNPDTYASDVDGITF